MSSFRSLLGRVCLVFASLLITLLVIEGAMRLGWLESTPLRSTAIKEKHSSRPGLPDFRLPVDRLEQRSTGQRIVVVGDSFAWGDGVYARDAFPHRMEQQLLDRAGDQSIEVVNWSRPGWNTVHQVRSLLQGRKLRWLRPDLMILAFVLNDPEPVSLGERRRLMGVPPHGGQRTPAVRPWFVRVSRLGEFVWTRWRNTRSHRTLARYYRNLYEGEHWEACRAALGDLREASQRGGFPLVMVIFPVFDGPLGDDYRYADLHAKIAAVADDLGIPVLDLAMAYRDVEARRLAVVPFIDAHPSELAHRIAADVILDWLAQQDLIPPPAPEAD